MLYEVITDNLATMVKSSNFKNFVSGNTLKTFFSNKNKDYSKFLVDVQVLGQKGLDMLRQKANNNAITLIESAYAVET